jgi:plastocyanin
MRNNTMHTPANRYGMRFGARKSRSSFYGVGGALGLALLLISPAFADTVTVTVAPNSAHVFSPDGVIIKPGDTVKWVWDDNNHTVTSGDTSEEIAKANGMFDSGNRSKGSQFSFTFPDVGKFDYFCVFHHGMGMDGTVEVRASAAGTVGNVSTRLPIGTDDNVLIEGFIVQGPAGSTKKMIVRAIGPSLVPFGITDAVANPTLEIHDANNATVATNNDWKTTQTGGLITSDQVAEINASQLAPSNDLESAIIASLAPGSYTAVVRGAGNTTGTGVVDAYDLNTGSTARLANIATRGLIQPADKLMIAGFIVQNASLKTVVRAIGPSLAAFGISNALPDTTLQLRDQNGVIVKENDDWQSDQKQELESTGLQPSNNLEAAVVATIAPGQYTVQVRGKPETTGTGVVQVYFLQ